MSEIDYRLLASRASCWTGRSPEPTQRSYHWQVVAHGGGRADGVRWSGAGTNDVVESKHGQRRTLSVQGHSVFFLVAQLVEEGIRFRRQRRRL